MLLVLNTSLLQVDVFSPIAALTVPSRELTGHCSELKWGFVRLPALPGSRTLLWSSARENE